jgi:hypothetical protein
MFAMSFTRNRKIIEMKTMTKLNIFREQFQVEGISNNDKLNELA